MWLHYRDRGYRRSLSKSRDRYDSSRGRDLGHRYRSRSCSYSPDYMLEFVNLQDAPLLNLPNIKHLELMSGQRLRIFQFLESCHELEHLSIEVRHDSKALTFFFLHSNFFYFGLTLNSLILYVLKQKTQVYCPLEPKSCWFKPHSVPTCMLKTLRTMKYENCFGRIDGIQFLEYMLGHVEVLKRLTITWNNERVKDEK
ncbi:F-box domain, FBD domain, Leucine-rich repeat domain, L domain-like protein [Artemisia annua]|uniref:F-box domain, FBD domain, Leucine-rich repeat domain, L domain-like protein n=1 Tax=Artemisia annua TaxID=35608 RepID=A0A2U1NJN3_ARTAN|nr:F-box domain, FBD domain, Leucine-rich repeat domain, L domain-like protein [Artemisia annua]